MIKTSTFIFHTTMIDQNDNVSSYISTLSYVTNKRKINDLTVNKSVHIHWHLNFTRALHHLVFDEQEMYNGIIGNWNVSSEHFNILILGYLRVYS